MNKKNIIAIRAFASFLLLISIIVFAASFSREFADNGYKFDFTNMSNPEHSLIVFVVGVLLIGLSFVFKSTSK
jgi:hypothetical protein